MHGLDLSNPRPEHQQNGYDFFYCGAGTSSLEFGDEHVTIKPGEMAVSYPLEPHAMWPAPKESGQVYHTFLELTPQDGLIFYDLRSLGNRRIFPVGERREFFRECMQTLALRRPLAMKQVFYRFSGFVYDLLLKFGSPDIDVKPKVSLLQQAFDRIYKAIHTREKLLVEDLARDLDISVEQLNRLFNEKLGMPPGKYMLNYRIKAAAQLILSTDRKLSDIAGHVGFEDPHHFSRLFKSQLGISPSEYRKKGRKISG
jgi:AraC-like DNA-binding protein